MDMKKHFLKIVNLFVIVSLGICYVELLKFVMNQLISDNVVTSIDKMVFTGSSTLISCLLILVGNLFITRQNSLHVGYASGLVAFLYFYVIKHGGHGVIGVLVMTFMTDYSLFAMIAFTLFPVATGWLLNKRFKRNGFPLNNSLRKRVTIYIDHSSDGDTDLNFMTTWLEKWKKEVHVDDYSTGGWEHIWNIEASEDALSEIPENWLCDSEWASR